MNSISMYDANDFVENVTIENVKYKLHFGWNGSFWSMDIRDSEGTNILNNIVLVPNFPLLLQYQRHIDIKGQILAIRNDDIQTIGRDDFTSGKATLIYMSEEDIANAVA